MKNVIYVLSFALLTVGCSPEQPGGSSDLRLTGILAQNCASYMDSVNRLIPASKSTLNTTWELVRNADNEIIALKSFEDKWGPINEHRVYTLSNAVSMTRDSQFQVLASDEDLNKAPGDFHNTSELKVLFVRQSDDQVQADLHIIFKEDMEKIKDAQANNRAFEDLLSTKVEACYTHRYKRASFVSIETDNADEKTIKRWIEWSQNAQAHVTVSARAIKGSSNDEAENTNEESEGDRRENIVPTFQNETYVNIDIHSTNGENAHIPLSISFSQPTTDFFNEIATGQIDGGTLQHPLCNITNQCQYNLKSKNFNPFEFVFDVTAVMTEPFALTISEIEPIAELAQEDEKVVSQNSGSAM